MADRLWPDLSPIARAQKTADRPLSFGLHGDRPADYWATLAESLRHSCYDKGLAFDYPAAWQAIDTRIYALADRALDLACESNGRVFVYDRAGRPSVLAYTELACGEPGCDQRFTYRSASDNAGGRLAAYAHITADDWVCPGCERREDSEDLGLTYTEECPDCGADLAPGESCDCDQ